MNNLIRNIFRQCNMTKIDRFISWYIVLEHFFIFGLFVFAPENSWRGVWLLRRPLADQSAIHLHKFQQYTTYLALVDFRSRPLL